MSGASIQLKLRAFTVPNFVLVEMPPRPREEGFKDPLGLKVSEIDELTLAQLCEQFREEVFKKAGKIDPRLKETK